MRLSAGERRVSSIATKPSAVNGSPVSASQDAAPASVTHSASSKPIRRPSAQISAPGSTRMIVTAGQQGDAALGENPLEPKADPAVVRRQQCIAGDEGDLDRSVAQPREAMLRRQCQLDAAGAAADHGEAQSPHRPGAAQQGFPARREMGDRLDRDRVLDGAGNIICTRGRADVERQQIVADRRMRPAQHMAVAALDADRLVMDQPGTGKPRQPAEIDMTLVKSVMAGDPARQHPRIGRLDITGNEGHTHPRHRPHGKTFQHMDMGVATADEHEILSDRNLLVHRFHYAGAPIRRRAVSGIVRFTRRLPRRYLGDAGRLAGAIVGRKTQNSGREQTERSDVTEPRRDQ